jgi:hypothetical protein
MNTAAPGGALARRISDYSKNHFLSAVPRRGPEAEVFRAENNFQGSGVNRIGKQNKNSALSVLMCFSNKNRWYQI